MGANARDSTCTGTDAGAAKGGALAELGRIRGGRSRARAVTAVVAATCMSWLPGGRALAEARDARTPGGSRTPSFEVGTHGLRSLRFAGEEFVDRECFRVARAVMKRWDGTTYQADLKPVRRELDGGGKRLLLSYRWGKVACTFAPGEGRLRLTIEVTNESDDILALSLDGSGTVSGVSFDDEDAIEHRLVSGSWAMTYDGSALHPGWPAGDLNAIHFVPEPGVGVMLASGAIFLLTVGRRRARVTSAPAQGRPRGE